MTVRFDMDLNPLLFGSVPPRQTLSKTLLPPEVPPPVSVWWAKSTQCELRIQLLSEGTGDWLGAGRQKLQRTLSNAVQTRVKIELAPSVYSSVAHEEQVRQLGSNYLSLASSHYIPHGVCIHMQCQGFVLDPGHVICSGFRPHREGLSSLYSDVGVIYLSPRPLNEGQDLPLVANDYAFHWIVMLIVAMITLRYIRKLIRLVVTPREEALAGEWFLGTTVRERRALDGTPVYVEVPCVPTPVSTRMLVSESAIDVRRLLLEETSLRRLTFDD